MTIFSDPSHHKIYHDDDGYEYIKLKNSWAELPIIEVYLKKGAWKKNDYENDSDMFCLLEPESEQQEHGDFDEFMDEDEETNSICYYIDLATYNNQICFDTPEISMTDFFLLSTLYCIICLQPELDYKWNN